MRYPSTDTSKWRKVVSLGLGPMPLDALDELAKMDCSRRGYGKPNRSETAARIFREELARRREEDRLKAAAAAAAKPLPGQLEVPLDRTKPKKRKATNA